MNPHSSTHLIGMHGWAGDHHSWHPWVEQTQQRGWSFSWGERGYGASPPLDPQWPKASHRRIVIAHSLGPHLIPAEVWRTATGAVLLASFSRFLPEGRAGRPLQAAVSSMRQRLEAGEVNALLHDFLAQAAAPQSTALLPEGPLEQGISAEGVHRLLDDLTRLERTAGLPEGFPAGIPVLLVEAEQDRIVAPASREQLRQELPQATVWSRPDLGHCLLDPSLPAAVLSWIADACA